MKLMSEFADVRVYTRRLNWSRKPEWDQPKFVHSTNLSRKPVKSVLGANRKTQQTSEMEGGHIILLSIPVPLPVRGEMTLTRRYSFEHKHLTRDSWGLIETRRGVNVTTTKNLNKTSDGRCTSTSSMFDQFADCAAYFNSMACVNRTDCIWKFANDSLNYSCACSFGLCKCGNPAEGGTKTIAYNPSTMLLVITPVLVVGGLMGCIFLGYYFKAQLARWFPSFMAEFILETIRVKDEDEMRAIKSKADKKNQESALKSEGDDEFDIERALKKYQDRGLSPSELSSNDVIQRPKAACHGTTIELIKADTALTKDRQV